MSLKIDMENVVNGPDDATNFTAQLIRLIFKADGENRRKLGIGFPNAVLTYERWYATEEILDLPYD